MLDKYLYIQILICNHLKIFNIRNITIFGGMDMIKDLFSLCFPCIGGIGAVASFI